MTASREHDDLTGVRPPRVLVVEDERGIQTLLHAFLTDEGYDVRVAGTGRAALGALDDWLPDVILLDLTMPEMGGEEFRAEQLALGSPAAEVPVILVTGTHDADKLVATLSAAGLVSKPFDLDELLAAVTSVVASREPSSSRDA